MPINKKDDWNHFNKKKRKVEILELNNYEEYTQFIGGLEKKVSHIYFLFTGSKKENGRSWCIYCIMAEPIVREYLRELETKNGPNIIFAYVSVGDREYWKNPQCPFRTDSRTRLMVIPTITKWKGVQRLEGSQCNQRDLLAMLFEEE